MQFQINFTGLTPAELAEVVDAFAGSASEVVVSSTTMGKYDALTRWSSDPRFGAVQLNHLHRCLDQLAERNAATAAPLMFGDRRVTFSGDDSLFVQLDGFDVVGLELADDGKQVIAWPIDANAQLEEGDKTHDARVVWPVHPERRDLND